MPPCNDEAKPCASGQALILLQAASANLSASKSSHKAKPTSSTPAEAGAAISFEAGSPPSPCTRRIFSLQRDTYRRTRPCALSRVAPRWALIQRPRHPAGADDGLVAAYPLLDCIGDVSACLAAKQDKGLNHALRRAEPPAAPSALRPSTPNLNAASAVHSLAVAPGPEPKPGADEDQPDLWG